MARLSALLLVVVIACALSVITSQHRARRLFIDLEAAQTQAKKLDEEWTQLQLEQGTWATHKRVEAIAAQQLGMRLPEPATTRVLTVPAEAGR